jgi:protein-L-isoaspartate(D-aspartate) O-methyltransferase
MPDFATARRMMVDCQVRTYDVTDQNLLAAMLAVPREKFVPAELASVGYLDMDVPVAKGRRLLKPMVLAKLIQAAAIRPNDRVLDVGCATGYASAILARLAGTIVALEQDPGLASHARRVLTELGETHVSVLEGPLAAGCPSQAPYDVILLNGAAEVIPDGLLSQLNEGGRLVGIAGEEPALQAMLYQSIHGQVSGRAIFDAAGAQLPGFARPRAFAF